MKVNYLQMELPSIYFLPRQFLSGVAELVKGFLATDHVYGNKLSYWQLVFLQSKANGCLYHGEGLPQINWECPKNTWLQERSHQLKDLEFAAHQAKN